jgi:hypothetical protein
MRRAIPLTEQFQHFVEDIQDGFRGNVSEKTCQFKLKVLEGESLPSVFSP